MKKINILFVSILLTVFAVATSCGGKDTPENPKIEINSEAKQLGIDCNGGVLRAEFKVNVDWSISVEEGASWIKVLPGKGSAGEVKLRFEIEPNIAAEIRNTTATIKAGNGSNSVTETITIEQEAFENSGSGKITISSDSKTVGYEAGTFTVAVFAKEAWSTSDVPSWITLDPDQGSGNAVVNVNYEKNATVEGRSAKVKFEAGGESVTLAISQAKNSSGEETDIKLDKSTTQLLEAGGKVEIAVTSNKRWELGELDSWVSIDPKVGIGNTKVTVICRENNKTVDRQSVIKFVADDKEVEFTLKQKAATEEHDDRAVLEAFYAATNGDSWDYNEKWCSNELLKDWPGVVTNDKGRVTQIVLYYNKLSGTLIPELGNLKYLEVLRVQNNSIGGTLPKELGSLKYLKTLAVDNNKMTGDIPVELYNATSLKTLHLHINQFTGTISPKIGQLKALSFLYLGSNQLEGAIPAEIGQLTEVTFLQLGPNKLSGTLPAEMGNMNKMTYLSLSGNQLEGDIPSTFSSMTNLFSLFLNNNKFTGAIPEFLANTNINSLDLSYNNFTGSIPARLGNPDSMRAILLNDNKLSGTIPTSMGDYKALLYLDLKNNNLTGGLPKELAKCESLGAETNIEGPPVDLSGNQLTGTIPAECKAHRFYSRWNLNPQQEGFGLQ